MFSFKLVISTIPISVTQILIKRTRTKLNNIIADVLSALNRKYFAVQLTAVFCEMEIRKCLFAVCFCLALNFCFGQVQEGTPCETPNQQYGTCINLKTCKVLLDLLLKQRSNPQTRNYLRSSTCGYIGNTPMVCCPQVTPKNNPTPLEEVGNADNTGDSTEGSDKNDALLKPPDCGFSNITNSRVVGGVPAKLGEFPWIVSLGYRNSKNPNQPKWLCGGTLITDRHILTAAHCVQNRRDLYIARIGELDLYDDNDGAHPVDIPLIKAKIHENYSPGQFTNDIAILTLERKPENPGVWPICLPWQSDLRNNNFIKYQLTVAGWGALFFNGPSSSVLQLTQLPVVNNDLCTRAYGNRSVIDDRIICAGYLSGGKDACQGDSGGPLMWGRGENNTLRFFQIGVVSYGFRCAEAGYPGVYTKVTHFVDWIRRNLN